MDILSLTKPDIHTREVDGVGTVHIKLLTVKEAMALQVDGDVDPAEYMAKAVAAAVVDEDGARSVPEDKIDCLQDIPFSKLNAILQAVLEVNGMNRQGIEEAPGN